jgi:hypothetical protein
LTLEKCVGYEPARRRLSFSRAASLLTTKREVMKIGIAIGLVVGCGVALAACGSDDNSGGGGAAVDCSTSMQRFTAPGCDATTRSCFAAPIPAADADACNQCVTTAQQIQGTVTQLSGCTCQNCAGALAACFQSGDTARDGLCRAIVECGQRTGCQGVNCYIDAMAMPTGPCVAEIDAAAAASNQCAAGDIVCVVMAQTNEASAVSRAYAVGACATGDPTGGITGACEGVPNTP